jgi:5'-3' exonuclease
MSTRPILLVDGLNVFTRHFVVNPTMSDQGNHVGGFVGFLKAIRLLCEKINPSKVIIAWEGGGSARRRAIFPEYKQGRRPQKLNRFYSDIPDTYHNRDNQVTLIIESLRHVPVVQIYVADCEADDVIGYIVKHKLKDQKCVIVSSDKDLYQLLSDTVVQWSPGQKLFITSRHVREKFGVHHTNFCTTRCFTGDPSDGIPGIARAGFKSLSKRIEILRDKEDVSVDDVVSYAEAELEKKQLLLYANIVENAEVARRNWKIMFLGTSNLAAHQIEKINYTIDTFEPKRNKIELMRMMLREGIQNFDVDSFFMTVNIIGQDA